jgi:hypothetical protein
VEPGVGSDFQELMKQDKQYGRRYSGHDKNYIDRTGSVVDDNGDVSERG